MKHEKKEVICYIIEREYLEKITDEELIKRIIQSHAEEKEL